MWDNKFCFKILHLSLIVCIFLGTVWGDKKVEVVKAISNEKADLFPNIQEPSCNLSQRLRDEIRSYQPIADRIIEVVLNGEYRGRSFEELAKFVDKYPHRPTGTQNLERSIDYMIEKANKDGLHNVTTQEVPVTQWIRGEERAEILEPLQQRLDVIGLGPSVGTPAEGITAEVLVVHSFVELDEKKDLVAGKIVLYNQGWLETYDETVKYRWDGARASAQYGAVAALVESITPYSLGTLHTGVAIYADNVTKIPVAAVTREDAEMFSRIYQRGEKIMIKLTLLDEMREMTVSRNTFISIPGIDENLKHEIVGVSGHIDAWDIGQGAVDDGTGIIISEEALNVINHLNLKPRRTLQAIFWTGEEMDFQGVNGFISEHRSDLQNYNGVFEADWGTNQPLGIDFAGHPDAGCIVEEVLQLLHSINATLYRRFPVVGADISKLVPEGVPALNLNVVNDDYFYFHHTGADHMRIQDSGELDMCLALYAVTSFVIADLSVSLPREVPNSQAHV